MRTKCVRCMWKWEPDKDSMLCPNCGYLGDLLDDEKTGLKMPEYACVGIYETYTYDHAFQISAAMLTVWKVGKTIVRKLIKARE